MSTNFSLKSEKNRANLYIINMIGSSYFNSNASEKRIAKRFVVDYKELADKDQLNRERNVIQQFDSLPADFLHQIATLRCTVYARVTERHACAWFRTGFEEVAVTMSQDGRITDISPIIEWSTQDWEGYVGYILKEEEKARRADRIHENIERLRIDFMTAHSLTNCVVHTQKIDDETWVWLDNSHSNIVYILDEDGNTQSSFHFKGLTIQQWKSFKKRIPASFTTRSPKSFCA